MVKDLKKIVARNIRQLRTERGLTQRELARRAGLDPRSLNRLEREPQNLSLALLEAVATALGVTAVSLLADDGVELANAEDLRDFDQAWESLQRIRGRAKAPEP